MLMEALVTICRTGKRAGLRYRPPMASPIPIVTVVSMAKGKSARQAAAEVAKGHAAEREAMSVAMEARARHGRADALLRFVDENRLRGELYRAGLAYGQIIHDARIAMGLHVPGQPQRAGVRLNEAQLAARKDFALMARASADRVLFNRARIEAMVRLTFDELYPPTSETRMLRTGLFALARHFGMIKEGINEGK